MRSNTEKQKIYHVEVVSENITWNCSCSPQAQVWAWRVQGCWTCAFVTLVPWIVNMWFHHARSWPGENKFPWCFLHKTILHHACFPSLLFFFLWKFRKILQQFLYPIAFCTEWEKKKLEIEKGRQEHWRRAPTFFSLHYFFLCTFTKILYHFFFYPISFCAGINTKTVEKNTRNWKGKAGAFETYSYFFYLWTFTKILYIFVSILLLFVLG